MASTFEEKLFEYADTFGENFPTFNFPYESEAKIMAMIDECLKRGKPYDTGNHGEKVMI